MACTEQLVPFQLLTLETPCSFLSLRSCFLSFLINMSTAFGVGNRFCTNAMSSHWEKKVFRFVSACFSFGARMSEGQNNRTGTGVVDIIAFEVIRRYCGILSRYTCT